MSKMWDVAIIGAGAAGLGAAKALQDAGRSVVLLDKGRAPGGRICSRREAGCVFDQGAQNIKAEGSALGHWGASLPGDLIRPFTAPVMLHRDGAVKGGDRDNNAETKWAAAHGLEYLAREMARGLPVWTDTRVAQVEQNADDFALRDERGHVLCQARRVILTAPGPQSADLLEGSTLQENARERIESLRSVPYSRCLTVMLRYDAPLPVEWYALLAEDRAHPLLWLARENAKGYVLPDNRTALVAQLGPEISRTLYEADADDITRQAIAWVREAAPELRALPAPNWTSVKRWRYSQSQSQADWHVVNPPGASLLIAGDALCPKSRVEAAYDTGLRAARQILDS